jgi:uncharacterized RDD family membrane protein YckC
MLDIDNANVSDFNNPLLVSSRKRRIVAFLLDHFIFTFLIVSLIFVFVGPDFLDSSEAGKKVVTILVGLLFGFIVYFSKDSFKGISPGKWMMGIMVRDETNRDLIPSFGRLFLRNCFIILWPLEFIVLALSGNKKRIGDIVAKTLVLKNPNKPLKLQRLVPFIGVGILFFIFLFGFIANAMKNSEAYQLAVQEIEKNSEIKQETGGIVGYGFMPTGNIEVSGDEGKAHLEITVKGNLKDITVTTYLESKNGKWELIELTK